MIEGNMDTTHLVKLDENIQVNGRDLARYVKSAIRTLPYKDLKRVYKKNNPSERNRNAEQLQIGTFGEGNRIQFLERYSKRIQASNVQKYITNYETRKRAAGEAEDAFGKNEDRRAALVNQLRKLNNKTSGLAAFKQINRRTRLQRIKDAIATVASNPQVQDAVQTLVFAALTHYASSSSSNPDDVVEVYPENAPVDPGIAVLAATTMGLVSYGMGRGGGGPGPFT
jgi:hypothetical protein